ncbi:hypothetical protein GH714_019417 [Hevea brasiliensis]|uniref:Uncharacterized protein n=1 Tax=Hevea brasiliensis TaxID=3981 RepID=A0A6A6N0T7_HEVBR|nr:hypothetical protein GH714_019417 [Hevea brasiliensis]
MHQFHRLTGFQDVGEDKMVGFRVSSTNHVAINFEGGKVIKLGGIGSDHGSAEIDIGKADMIKNVASIAKDLRNLRLLDLRDSSELTRVPDLSSVPNLEFLCLRDCLSLIEIPSSIGELKCLKELNLRCCSKLHSIPRSICNLKSLTRLDISCCSNVNGLPENIRNLELLQKLNIASSGIKALPSYINQLKNLVSLRYDLCEGLTLPPLTEHEDEDRIGNFLNFSNCINLDKEKVMEDVLETHLLKHKIVRLCITGDEVPQRMRYKNQSGSCLSFTLDKPNLIGVSLCLVFDPKNHYGYHFRLTCEAQFIDKSGHNSKNSKCVFMPSARFWAVDELESKHVRLWNELLNMEDSFVEASFQFCLYKFSSSSYFEIVGPYTEGPLFVVDSALEAFVCDFSAEFAAALSTFICCIL